MGEFIRVRILGMYVCVYVPALELTCAHRTGGLCGEDMRIRAWTFKTHKIIAPELTAVVEVRQKGCNNSDI